MGLECVELVIAWEREFSITIPDGIAATLITPAHAANAIEQILLSAGKPMELTAIEEIIRTTTLDISGMKPAHYRQDGRFCEDFGID
jgi:hypothetical protein